MILFKHQNHTIFQQVNLRSPFNLQRVVNNSGYMRGRAWRGAKKLKKAIADFGIAIKKDSKLVEAYVARGGSRLAMGETAKAEADFKKALAVAQPKAKKTVEQSIEEARDKGKK